MYDCILSILFANSFQYFVTVIFKTVENMVADFFRNISRFYKHFCTCALSGTERPPTHFQDESEGSGLVTPTRGREGAKKAEGAGGKKRGKRDIGGKRIFTGGLT